MKKRMFLMLVTVAALIGVLGAVKLKQVKTAIAQQASFQPPPEAVTTIVARQERWAATLSAIGSVAAVRGVTVAADLPGSSRRSRSTRARRSRRATCWCDWTRGRSGRNSPPPRRSATWPAPTSSAPAGLKEERSSRSPTTTRPRPKPSRPRPPWARSGRPSAARRSSRPFSGRPRHPPGEPRAVPRGRRRRSSSLQSLRSRSTSTSPLPQQQVGAAARRAPRSA